MDNNMDNSGVYMKRAVPSNKRELSLRREMELLEMKANTVSETIEELKGDLKEIQEEYTTIYNKILVAQSKTAADTLDSYRY